MRLFNRKHEVIDLAAMERGWGFPTPCPECGSPGYLDHIDMAGRVMDQHCPTCSHTWRTTEAETQAPVR